jgi:dTDP-4-amino-4,6-dideoxygalactose transaminase
MTMFPDPRIYLSVPHMSGLERQFIDEAFSSNWLSSVGPNIDAFEDEMVSVLGGGVQALAVSSGTAALHLVLRAVGVGPGDRVAVSTLTFAASVWPILYLGGKPVFLDSEPVSGNLDPELVERYLDRAAARRELPMALIVAHLYGQHADISPISAACVKHGVILVEDSAESLGATYGGRQTGLAGDYSILSFNGNKIITTTGGGMVLSRNAEAIARMNKWANQSREPALEYVHKELGYNYRMSNVLAGIGRGQLQVLGDRVTARRAVAARYAAGLADVPGVALQAEAPWGTHSRWLSIVYLDPSVVQVSPVAVIKALDSENIESRPVWRPMHTQPMFTGAERHGGAVAERLFRTGLCLPSSSSLTTPEQDRVINSLNVVLGQSARFAGSTRQRVS